LENQGIHATIDPTLAGAFADNLVKLGLSEYSEEPEKLARILFDRYVESFQEESGRLPKENEIEEWLQGSEPSAFFQEAFLIDEVLRLRIEKWRTEPQPDSPGSPDPSTANASASFMGIGLAEFFNSSSPNESFFEGLASWQKWGLLGLGVLAVAGLGLWAYGKFLRTEASKDIPRWYEKPPYSQLRLPLTLDERKTLRPFFKDQEVPMILTGKEWRLIEDRLFGGSLVRVRDRVDVTNQKFWALCTRVDEHLQQLKKEGPPQSSDEGEESLEVAWEGKVRQYRNVIPISERMEEVEMGIPHAHDSYLEAFKMEEIGDQLRGLFRSQDPETREKAIRLYYYHVR
jgi:hypothetical protein